LVLGDKANPPHVRGEIVAYVDPAGGLKTIGPAAQVEEFVLVGGRRFVLGRLDVHTPHPGAPFPQVFHEVMTDEAPGACHHNPCHDDPPSPDLAHAGNTASACRTGTSRASCGPGAPAALTGSGRAEGTTRNASSGHAPGIVETESSVLSAIWSTSSAIA